MKTEATAPSPSLPSPPKQEDVGNFSSFIAQKKSQGQAFFESINPLNFISDNAQITPRQFLIQFYTERNLSEKLKDVDALINYYTPGKLHELFSELDKR